MKSNKTLVKRVLSAVLTAVLILSTILCFAVVAKTIGNDSVPDLFGYRFFYIVTGSMEPTVHVGETIIVRERQEYEVGDIVTYIAGESSAVSGQPITHRVIKVLKDGDRITGYITQGDANNTPDAEVKPESIYGKMVWPKENKEQGTGSKNKLLSKIFAFLSDRNGFFVILVVPVALFAVAAMKDFMKAQKKVLEEKQKQQTGLSDETANVRQNNDDKEERP